MVLVVVGLPPLSCRHAIKTPITATKTPAITHQSIPVCGINTP